MSTAPNFDPENPENAPRKAGGGGWKWLIIALVGLCGVCCCGAGGGIYYFFSKLGISYSPEVARTRTREMADFPVPEGFEPKMSSDSFGVLKMVAWSRDTERIGMGEVQKNTMDAMGMQLQVENLMKNIPPPVMILGGSDAETKDFTVRGQPVSFRIDKVKNQQGAAMRRIVGSFDNGGKTVLLDLWILETNYKEDKIQEMIEAIK